MEKITLEMDSDKLDINLRVQNCPPGAGPKTLPPGGPRVQNLQRGGKGRGGGSEDNGVDDLQDLMCKKKLCPTKLIKSLAIIGYHNCISTTLQAVTAVGVTPTPTPTSSTSILSPASKQFQHDNVQLSCEEVQEGWTPAVKKDQPDLQEG